MKSYDFRLKAREKLQGTYGICLLVSFIAMIIIGSVSELFIIGMLITGPIAVGVAFFFI